MPLATPTCHRSIVCCMQGRMWRDIVLMHPSSCRAAMKYSLKKIAGFGWRAIVESVGEPQEKIRDPHLYRVARVRGRVTPFFAPFSFREYRFATEWLATLRQAKNPPIDKRVFVSEARHRVGSLVCEWLKLSCQKRGNPSCIP